MNTLYIFAPTTQHAAATVASEPPIAGEGVSVRTRLRRFHEIYGLEFKEGDWIMIRGLKHLPNVDRMKYVIDHLIATADSSKLQIVMVGLDNYRVIRK